MKLKLFHVGYTPALDDDYSQVVWATDHDAAVALWLRDGLGSGMDWFCARQPAGSDVESDTMFVHELSDGPTDPKGNVVLWSDSVNYLVHSKEGAVGL